MGSFKSVFNILIILTDLLCETAWITGDVIITLVSILLYRYYEELNEKLSISKQNIPAAMDQLEVLHQSVQVTSLLAKRVTETFSKLVLVTVSCNVINILSYLCHGLASVSLDSEIFIIKFTFFFSFGYLVLRFFLSIYLASRLTEMVW